MTRIARFIGVLLLAVVVLMMTACQPRNPSITRGINVWHIVLVRLNDPHDDAAGQKIIDASKSFESIPGVLSVHAGRIASGDRLNQSSDYDIGIVMGFKSFQAIQNYVSDPAHRKAVDEVLNPRIKGYTSYDFANE